MPFSPRRVRVCSASRRRRFALAAAGVSLLAAAGLGPARVRAGDVSFSTDVMAALSKAGCNQGVCHGNKSGKGGFKLSLRGEDPAADYRALTRSLYGRRTNPSDPADSLILRKATASVPHEGGQRFERDSELYRLLASWIGAGCPPDSTGRPRLENLEVSPRTIVLRDDHRSARIRAVATYSDGSRRDVTGLSVFEQSTPLVDVSPGGEIDCPQSGETTILVRYLDRQIPVPVTIVDPSPEFRFTAPESDHFVDRAVFEKLRLLRITPSRVAGDRVFIRRLYLDLTGSLPTAAEAREFFADPRSDKRDHWIDRLLDSDAFADFWALKWSDLLRNEEKTLDRKGVQVFHHWIRRAIADGMPLSDLAREIVRARGSTYHSPPANYYRALRDPVSRAETTAQLFLGRRLKCAQCHNHPFDRWTQDDYYDWTSLFGGVRYRVLENRRRDRNDKHEFAGEQIVWVGGAGRVLNERTGEPATPRFLGDSTGRSGIVEEPLEALARWIADPENPYFAKAQANRIWFHLMGRGLVDPVDDFRATNPASHPALLDALASELRTSGFDLRHLVRVIVRSKTYQLSSEPTPSNREDTINYARALPRRLTAEQLLDSLARALEAPVTFNGYPRGTLAREIPGVIAIRRRDQRPSPGDDFLRQFGKPKRLISCECERTTETTMGQAFQLISGRLLDELLRSPDGRIASLATTSLPIADAVTELYWRTLSRTPTEEELARTLELLDFEADRRAALEDLAWSLVNAKEFVLRM